MGNLLAGLTCLPEDERKASVSVMNTGSLYQVEWNCQMT